MRLRPGEGGDRGVLRLSARFVRRSALVLAASMAAYVVLESVNYEHAYPDAASRARIAMLGSVGAARALQGVPYGTEQVGGFVVWDGGWMMEAIIAVWAILLTTRLMRGEEDEGRADWVLAGPVKAVRAMLLQLVVLASASCLVALAVAVAFVLGGADVVGSVLFGAGLAGFAATFLALSAITAQLFGLRRRAVGAASAAMGTAFVVRMVGDSADSRGWLRMVTPFGWMEELEPFSARRWPMLLLLELTPVLLSLVAAALRARRDLGGAVVGGADRHAPRLYLLGSAEGYAWRGNEGVLLMWAFGLGTLSFAMGALVRSMTDYLASDESFRNALESFGMGLAVTADGFVSVIGMVLGVGFALYACWRVAAVRAEEASGRAALMLSRRLTRVRWLAGHVGSTVIATGALLAVNAVALWAGCVLTGADVSFLAALRSVANTASTVCLFAGFSVLTLGVLPRATAVLPVSLVIVSYLVQFLGPTLELPGWVMDLSPFYHLAYVPAQPFAVTAAAVMAGIGVAAGLAGLVAFHARDLREA